MILMKKWLMRWRSHDNHVGYGIEVQLDAESVNGKHYYHTQHTIDNENRNPAPTLKEQLNKLEDVAHNAASHNAGSWTTVTKK